MRSRSRRKDSQEEEKDTSSRRIDEQAQYGFNDTPSPDRASPLPDFTDELALLPDLGADDIDAGIEIGE